MAKLGDLIIKLGMNIDEFVSGTAQVAKELDAMARVVEKNFAAFDKIGARLTSLGTGLTAALTLPLAGIGIASVKMAGDFEASMNKVQAFGDITGESLKKLENLALDLGAKTKFSAKEAADGMAELAAAGLNASQVTAAMPAILNLAAAGELAVGEAARVSADLMGQFGIKAEDLGHAIDVIAKAAAASSATVAQMTESFRVVGAVATSAGLSLEDTSAALTVLAQGGRKAEQAGTDLRSVLASLLDPSEEAATAMEALGINVKNSAGNLKPFSAVMGELGKATGHTTEIFKIFGREGATGATLFAKAGEEAFSKIRKNLNDTNNDAQRMAETLNSGIKGAFEKAAGSIETAGIAIGKALGPLAEKGAGLIESLANQVTNLVAVFSKLPMPVQQAAIGMAAMAAAVGPILLGLGALSSSVTSVVGAVALLGKLPISIVGVGTALGGLTGILKSVSSAALDAFVVMPSKIPGIVAIVKDFGGALAGIPGLLSGIASSGGGAFTGIAEKLSLLSVTIRTAVADSFVALSASVSNISYAVSNGLVGALSTGEKAILAMGQAAAIAAAAFVGWKLGEWAYNAIPGVKAVGDAISELILKIPGIGKSIEYLSGATGAAARAQDDLAFSTKKLEAALASKGITVSKDGKSLEEYAAALRAAASSAGAFGGEAQKVVEAVSSIKNETSDAARGLKVAEKALSEIQAAFKVGAASQQDMALATERVRVAFQRLHPELGTNNEAARKAAEKAEKHAEALVKQKDALVLASAAVEKYKNNLDGLDNIKLIKLSLGGPSFKDYEEGLKKFGAEMEAARARVTTFYNEVAGGKNATEAIKQLGAAFANTEKALQDFGIESQISYQSLVKQNSDYLKQILSDTNLTYTQKEQARIVFAQREIDLARKTGQEIADAEIESLERQKAAYAKSHLDIEQSYKILGINSTAEIQRQADLVAAAYAKVAQSALSSQADIDKAHLASLQADADATIAHGKAISETRKREMADLEQITKEGHQSMELEWDAFANHVGDAIGELSIALTTKLFTGKGSFGDIAKTAWKGIQKSLEEDFIKPAEIAVSKFISKSIAALIGGEGIGGIQKAWKDATASMKEFFGAASSAAKAATKSAGGSVGIPFGGDTSEADFSPISGGSDGAGGMAGGVSSFTPMGIISAGIDAAGFTAIGLLLSRIVSTVGKVEVNTREMSTVMWQTGVESLQGIAKMSWQTLLQINDRLIDIRSAIFDPLTLTLELIWETLKRVGVGSGSSEGSPASGVPLVVRMPTILPLSDFEGEGPMTPKYSTGFLSAVFDQSNRDPFSAEPGTGRFSSVIEGVTNSLGNFSDAVQGAAGGIAGIVLPMTDFMKKQYGIFDEVASRDYVPGDGGVIEWNRPMIFGNPEYGPSIRDIEAAERKLPDGYGAAMLPNPSDIAPSLRSSNYDAGYSDGIRQLTQGTVGGRTGSVPLVQINGGTFSSRAVVDEITSGLVDRLRREGGLKF